ncbi:hypothetical protein GFM44_30855 [Rhizobium leguminosarum bv. viciae]|nr:hypothetical protein [Rhizobium leguminosarum bv. viciae]
MGDFNKCTKRMAGKSSIAFKPKAAIAGFRMAHDLPLFPTYLSKLPHSKEAAIMGPAGNQRKDIEAALLHMKDLRMYAWLIFDKDG